MAPRKPRKGLVPPDENMTDNGLFDYMKKAYRTYGRYTLERRAVVDFRDGLKPVQRRVLWTANDLGLTGSRGVSKKSAKIVGDCFRAGTMVSTPDGDVPIEKLSAGDLVMTGSGPREVTQAFANPEADLHRLTLSDGSSVTLTPGQEVKIRIGDKFFWKRADRLDGSESIVLGAD